MAFVLQSRRDRRVVRDNPNDPSVRQTCRHRTVTIAKVSDGSLTDSDEGTKKSSLTFHFPSGTTKIHPAPDGNKWLCVEDSIEPVSPMPSVSKHYIRSQTWETYSAWVEETFA